MLHVRKYVCILEAISLQFFTIPKFTVRTKNYVKNKWRMTIFLENFNKRSLSCSSQNSKTFSDNEENLCKTPPNKKTKLDNDNKDQLTPEQQQRIDANCLVAKIKRTNKITPALHGNIGPSWFQALENEFSKPYFVKLNEFLISERKNHVVYPPEDQVYSWTHWCDIKKVKVVILGQDPYHGPSQAHGLCFSVQKSVRPPPSLINIYEALSRDIPGFTKPAHGNLVGWAKQGVLLLNACLTVRAHCANSHVNKGWEEFTDAVISWINTNLHGVVFLLWGAYAQKKASGITKSRHHILQCVHPSPLSAHRGFFECKHFSKANALLEKQNKKPINWSDLKLDDE